jgi:hypothetical protein
MSDNKLKPPSGSPKTFVSTELNSLASSSWAISGAIDVDADYDLEVDLFLSITFGVAPTADTPIYCYMVRSMGDGTYEDGATSGPVLPKNGGVGQWLVRNVNTAQIMCIPNVRLPAGDFKLMIGNGTNQAFPASGTTIKALPSKLQVA